MVKVSNMCSIAFGVAALAVSSFASAGEVTGGQNPKPTGVRAHTSSICAFSGLEHGTAIGEERDECAVRRNLRALLGSLPIGEAGNYGIGQRILVGALPRVVHGLTKSPSAVRSIHSS